MRRTIVRAATMTVMAGLALATGAANSASAQANLDAGKSGAQMFALGCSACHRTPQEVAGAGRDFLLEHYTTGPRQADAMATYLDAVSNEPVRAAKPRRTLTTGPSAGVLELVWTGSIRAVPTAAARKTEQVPVPTPAPKPAPAPAPEQLYFEE
jgi:hypothetical protein